MTAKGAAPSLFVTLLYDDGRTSIDWLTRAFGFERILEVPGANGAIDHAELRLGDGILMATSTPRVAALAASAAVRVPVSRGSRRALRARAGRGSGNHPGAQHPYGARSS